MDKAQNRGKLSEMGSEWSPEAVKEAPSIQPCLESVCDRSRGPKPPQNGPKPRNRPVRAAALGFDSSGSSGVVAPGIMGLALANRSEGFG